MNYILTFILSISLLACSSKKKEEPPTPMPMKQQSTTDKNMTPDHNNQPEPHEPADKDKKHEKHTKWSYTGLTGPDMWGDLQQDYSLCKSGQKQSPINLVWSKPKKGAEIKFEYNETPYNLVDNGHTVKATFEKGNNIKISGHNFELEQVHFHAHSEHSVSGKFFPLEAHFVHKNDKGQLAVIAVLFVEGNANPYLESMWQQFPKEKNRSVASSTSFNPVNLIPPIKTHYHYTGSLTTPPCTEGVMWNVFNTPVELSSEQMNHFKVLYTKNFRPIQPLNQRKVINY
ncbi:MAG: carbonic anhydrase family protein [Bdellovibrionales bacterium]|nr:carbonic anhydrase family protein [Bdellovibrionales bacterium]